MLIIVEGPDGSGKSTLVQTLKKSLDQYVWTLSSNSRIKDWVEAARMVEALQDLPLSQAFVVDRYPLISEYVYGPILRQIARHALGPDQIASWLRGSLIVYCRPTRAKIVEGMMKAPQLVGIHKHIDEIIAGYDHIMYQLRKTRIVRVEEYNYHFNNDPSDLLELVDRYIEEKRRDA